jgi:hypothetical protein
LRRRTGGFLSRYMCPVQNIIPANISLTLRRSGTRGGNDSSSSSFLRGAMSIVVGDDCTLGGKYERIK